MTITHEQLDLIERKAYGATQGEWRVNGDPYCDQVIDAIGRRVCEGTPGNTAHIAASSPPTVLHLVAVYRAALAWTTASREAAALRARWAHTNDDTLLPTIERLDKAIVGERMALDLALGGDP